MAETPSSKSQIRAIKLMSLPTSDGTYMHAAAILSAAGLPADGLPAGQTWRSAGKLSDGQLVSLLGPASAIRETVKTTSEVRDEIRADRREREAQRRQDERDFWAAPYTREEPEYLDNLQPQSFPSHPQDEPIEQ